MKETDGKRHQRAQGDVEAPVDHRHADAGDRSELGADHHRPDDQDRRAEEDPDRRDQAGEDHEGEEVAAELDVLGGPGFDFLPDDGVGGGAAGRPLGPLRRQRELGVDLLDRDRAEARHVQLPQVLDDHARVLAGDVAEDHVAHRLAGGAGEEDEVAGGGRGTEEVEDGPRELGRHDDPQVDHWGQGYPRLRLARLGGC